MSRAALVCVVVAMGCSGSDDDVPAAFVEDEAYAPEIPDDLGPEITNEFFLAPVGAHWVFEGQTEEGLERIEIVVEEETMAIAGGATARVVRDTSFLDGVMTEDTRDWFAQDGDGNVWYLGEDTAEYEDGMIVSTEGAWQWGVDGALPGVVMLDEPEVGNIYRQEFLAGEAEDYAEVIAVNDEVIVPAGTFGDCVRTRDRSTLEPELDEYKSYCAGVGNVLTVEGDVRIELIEVSGL